MGGRGTLFADNPLGRGTALPALFHPPSWAILSYKFTHVAGWNRCWLEPMADPASLQSLLADPPPDRPAPPDQLSESAKAEWQAIVNRMPKGHFGRGSWAALGALCECAVGLDAVGLEMKSFHHCRVAASAGGAIASCNGCASSWRARSAACNSAAADAAAKVRSEACLLVGQQEHGDGP